MRRWVCGLLCLLLCASLVLPASASGGYTVSIPTEATIASGGTVTIPVTISEGTGSYNAVDIRITFDATKLEYASSTLTKNQVTLTNGTIYVRFYGKAQKTGAEAFSVTFQPKKMEESEVKITSAKVDNSDHALRYNAPEATIANGVTKVSVVGYKVTLPAGFKGSAIAYPGQDYTFNGPAGTTKYVVRAEINGKKYTCRDNGDGTYTILAEYITGPITVTAARSIVTPGTGGNNNHFVSGKGGTTGSSTTGAGGTTGSTASYKQLWVQPYVELDKATVFLVAVSGSPKSGQTYAYDGDLMFYTEKYRSSGAAFGENVYLYLQIVKSGEPLLEADAAKKITEVKGTSPTIDADLDMDGSGEINEKDAKLVYNVYNAMFWDFDDLPMASFLEADTNRDGIVNVKDSDVVVDGRSAR